jgi:hypothetical protein
MYVRLRVKCESMERVSLVDSLHDLRAEGKMNILLKDQVHNCYEALERVSSELYAEKQRNCEIAIRLETLEQLNNKYKVCNVSIEYFL